MVHSLEQPVLFDVMKAVTPTDQSSSAELREDLMWTLRTWPLELVRWQTLNSHRLDLRFNPEEDRYP